MNTHCFYVTKKGTGCQRKRASFLYCSQHDKVMLQIISRSPQINYSILDLLNRIPEPLNFVFNSNLMLCNKKLYKKYIKTTQYFLYFNQHPSLPLPKLNHFIPPNVNLQNLFMNLNELIIICNQTKEYFICYKYHLISLLYEMNKRFPIVNIYPYNKKLLYWYINKDFNHVIINYELQLTHLI